MDDPCVPPADNDAAYRSLVNRLLAPPYPGLAAAQEVRLLVGRLPQEVQDEVPLPEGVRVVGSLLRGTWEAEVVLDADRPAGQVFASFRKGLKAAGWRRPRFPRPVIFNHGFQATDILAYYRSRRGTALNLATRGQPGGPTDVRLSLSFHRQWKDLRPQAGEAARPSAGAVGQLPEWTLDSPIPPLAPPPRVQDYLGGGSRVGGNGQAESTILLTTELDNHALAAHYGVQLQRADWNRLQEGSGGPVAWSTWSLSNQQGRSWDGVLLVAELPGTPGRRVVYLRVDPMP
jgi:hypothetical protein